MNNLINLNTMQTRNVLSGTLAALLLAGCAKEMNEPAAPVKAAATYRFSATADDAMTKSFFKEEETASKYIYWEADDVFDFHDITASGAALAETGVASSTPVALSDDAKTISFVQDAHDYLVVSYPKGAVTLTTVTAESVQAKVTVASAQKLSSVLTPAYVPMASYPIALSEEARSAVEAGTAVADVLGEDPVKLYPLAGIVNMTVKGLPDVTTAEVTKIKVGVGVSGSAGKPQVGIMGDNVFELKDTVHYVSTYAADDAYQRHEIVLTADEPLSYTAADGVTACFVVNHSSEPLTWLYLTVYTADGAVYYKKFNLSSNKIATVKSRISSFSVDFTSGATVVDDSSRFAVEWSEGFLTYDAAGKTYQIGGKYDIGLYFRYGSAEGLEVFTNESYVTAYTKGGTQYLYSNFAMQSQPDWTPITLYTPEGGVVSPKTMETQDDVFAIAQSGQPFSGSSDPCSFVPVASGENKWRVPTKDEVQDLIDKGKVGLSFGNIDGSALLSSNKTPSYITMSDGEQEVTVRVSSYLQTTFGAYSGTAYKQLILGNYWAGAYFWTNTPNPNYSTTPTTATSQNVYAFNKTSLQGAINPFENYPTLSFSNMFANQSNANTDYIRGTFLSVRCVRSKEASGTKASGSQFAVNDYGTFE